VPTLRVGTENRTLRVHLKTTRGTRNMLIEKPIAKRICCIIIFVLSALTPSASAQNYADIKHLCAELEQKYALTFYFDEFPATSWPIEYAFATPQDYEKLRRYIVLFDHEFSKYPKIFLQKTRLKAVVFVKSLAFKTQLRTAIPDYGKEILLLDFIRGEHNIVYQQHVIHHEFYHMIEEEINTNPYWKDPDWKDLNVPGIQYGQGGKTVQHNSNVYELTHPEPGFINLYSQSAIEEDKAEIYAALFVTKEYEQVMRWTDEDRVLQKKTEYMKNFLKALDPEFSEQYWLELHQKR
jgi:hypothetical protein